MQRLVTAAALFLAFMPNPGHAQNDVDPYAGRINSYIQGTRDTYEHVRNWQALNARERLAADHGVMNAIASVPDPVGDLHPENVRPCAAEPSQRLVDVCSFFESKTRTTAHRKATDPEYVRGQIAMLRQINNCEAPGIECYIGGGIVIQRRFGR